MNNIIVLLAYFIAVAIIEISLGISIGIYIGRKSRRAPEVPKETEPTKLLTVGCSVKYHGRTWEIRRFMVDSENQTIAEIESRDNGEHIIRRTMVPVDELEEVEK